jgi:hypothetical protein
MKSKITALPSTEHAGRGETRGETATLVIQDEADFHENLELNYAAVKPAIDAGGQLIQCSTVNKKKAGTLFKEIFRNAPTNGFHAVFTVNKKKAGTLFKEIFRNAPTNGFHAVFHGWKSRPDRDQEWYDRVKREAPSSDGMSPELYMEQEHPATAEEALAPSRVMARVMAAFDVDALAAMQADVKEPVETRNGVTHIYQKWSSGTLLELTLLTEQGKITQRLRSLTLQLAMLWLMWTRRRSLQRNLPKNQSIFSRNTRIQSGLLKITTGAWQH